MIPQTANPLIKESGLNSSNGQLNVDKRTLQHKQYDNIFGVGDCLDIPTSKTFYGGLAQVAVVRNNLEKRLKGLPSNAEYDGFAEAPLMLSRNSLSWVSHSYDAK